MPHPTPKRKRFTRTELLAEFSRVGGSGRAEEQVDIPFIRRQLARSLRGHLRAQRRGRSMAGQRDRSTAVDLKKLQANDLD